MAIFKLTSVESVRDSNYPYLHPDCIVSDNGSIVRVLVTFDNLDDTEKPYFDLLFETLGIDESARANINLGTASYENDVFKGYCPIFFGVDNELQQMGIKIGTTNEQRELNELFIPCQTEQVTVKYGNKEVKEYQYTLNGSPITLKESVDNDDKGTGKFYISLKAYDETNYEDVLFTFPFLIDKSREHSSVEINKAWKTGEFHTIISEFGTGLNKIWLESNKAFLNSFENNTFPAGGVLMIVCNGKFKITEAGSHPKITSDICQTDWDIVATSHPELLVRYKKDGEFYITHLGTATNMQFTSARNNNEGYHFVLNNGVRCEETTKIRMLYENMAVIHFVSRAKEIKNTPVNTCTNLLERAQFKLKKFPELMAILKDNASEFISLKKQTKTLVASSVEEYREYQAASESLSNVNQFPKAASPSSVKSENKFPKAASPSSVKSENKYDSVDEDELNVIPF